MTKKEFNIDKYLLRAKDGLIIGGAIFSFLVFGVRLYQLPKTVEAQAAQISDHEKRIQKVEDSMENIAQIKDILTERVANGRRN